MAVDYTDLFTEIGKCIEKLNSYQTMAGTTFPADRDEIASTFDDFLAGTSKLQGLYDAGQRALVSLRTGLANIATLRLQDRETVLNELALISPSMNELLRALYTKMTADSQTLLASVVTLGTPTAAGTNVGNGKVYVDKLLDGVTAPGRDCISHLGYAGVNSQLCVPSETMTLECIRDSEIDGATEGQEGWSLKGGPNYSKLSWETEGSGNGPGVTTFNREAILLNKDFENWTSNTPQNWTISSGSAGVTVDSSTKYRGSKSLKFTGNAALTLSMSQAISRMQAKKKYLVSVAVKASSVPAAGALSIKFTGTGYTAGGTEEIAIAAGSMPTSWTLYSFWVVCPASLPSDWALTVAISGPLSNTVTINLDSFVLAPAVWHGGLSLAVVAGSTPWLRGDKVTWTVANNGAGVFQTFFRRWFGFQLPSAASPGNTIDDGLAT